MAAFKPGDTTVEAKGDPLLEVQVSPDNPLTVGKHVFQLVVTDDAGNKSVPQNVTIIVLDTSVPTAVIDVIEPTGRVNPSPEVQIPFGAKFALTGKRSTDIGGEVRVWTWTLLQP